MSADSLTEQDYYRWKNNALQPNVEREQTAMAAILQNKTNHAENEHPWQAYVESEETVVVADNPKAQD